MARSRLVRAPRNCYFYDLPLSASLTMIEKNFGDENACTCGLIILYNDLVNRRASVTKATAYYWLVQQIFHAKWCSLNDLNQCSCGLIRVRDYLRTEC
jgi:hypothetical protein